MSQLPSGFDWANGLGGNVGTPTPNSAVQIVSSNSDHSIPIEEVPGYPIIERAEQATITHKFSMSWQEAKNQIAYYGRGVVMVDSGGNYTRVLSSNVVRFKGGPTDDKVLAELTIVSESLSFDTPPDEFNIVEVELGLNIIKYPRYYYAFKTGNATNDLLNQGVIRLLQNYFENTNPAYRDTVLFQLYKSIGQPGTVSGFVPTPAADVTVTFADGSTGTITPITGTDYAKFAAMEIVQKYWNNEETPYIIGYEITWSAFYFIPPYLNPGGYTESPIYDAVPQLPDYFWSPTGTPADGKTIFDLLPVYNPQCYSSNGQQNGVANISWLRKADRHELQRTWTKVERRWSGTVVGHWDVDLYNNDDRPGYGANSSASIYYGYNIPSIPGLSRDIASSAINAGNTDIKVT